MVEVILLLFFHIIGGSIALDDVQPDVFLLSGKLGCDDAGVNRLPADECRMCIWCLHQGHSLSRGGGGGGAPSSMCPEYSSCSPDERLSCLDCIHLVSHSPSTLILYLFISLATWAVFLVSYIVLMFHVASLVNVLGVRRGISLAASFRLSRHCIISFLDGDPSLPRWVLWFLVVEAFVTRLFYG